MLAADALERLPFGGLEKYGARERILSGWPKPNPPLTVEERADEAARERRNVRAVAALFQRFDELLAAEHLLTYGDALTLAMRCCARTRASPRRCAIAGGTRWSMNSRILIRSRSNSSRLFSAKTCANSPVVGDVRQAIFAFNGADPEGIVRFRERTNCQRHPLSENRRSLKAILDVAHRALAIADAVPAALHTELTANRGGADSPAVRVQLFTGPDGLEREADAVARTARNLVDGGASPRSIAVLMRSRSKAALFAAALRRYGLAVQLHGGAGFFDAPEVREVVAWLRLVETPDDSKYLVLALQSAAIALGDGVVAELARSRELARAALAGPLDTFSPDERARLERFRAIARIVARLADVPLADAVRTIVLESGAEVARLGGDQGALDQVRANLDNSSASHPTSWRIGRRRASRTFCASSTSAPNSTTMKRRRNSRASASRS